MKKINKKLLATYLDLNNEKANQYLAKLGDEILAEIIATNDNDEIFEGLETMEEFVYRIPKQTIAAAKHIIAHPNEPKVIKILDGSMEGKQHQKLIQKTLELLNKIRYIAPDDVLVIVANLIRKDGDAKGKAIEVLKNFSKYDYVLLTKTDLGYGPQRKVLDFIKAWNPDERLANFEFVRIVTDELLSSSVSGLSSDTVDTVTFHSGTLRPADSLKELRREVIDINLDLYQKTLDESQKLRIVQAIEEISRGPMNVVYGDDLKQMLAEDETYLIEIYRHILFDKDGKLVASLAVASEVEKRLYWLNRNEGGNAVAERLRREILNNDSYKLFHLLASDETIYREEGGWDKAETNRREEIKNLIATINHPVEPWLKRFNDIADQINLIGEWQYRFFKIFLTELAKTKTDFAKDLLDKSYATNGSIKQFSASFLDGFREMNRLDLWDDAVGKIMKNCDVPLVSAIVYSLNYYDGPGAQPVDLKKVIREKDLDVLESIVRAAAGFDFLKNHKERNANLHSAVINTLMRNYIRDPRRMEMLIIAEIESHPDYNNIFVRDLYFGVVKQWIDYAKFSDKGVAFLVRWLIELPDLDWQIQDVIANLGKKEIRIVYDILWGRIQYSAEWKSDKLSIAERVRYEAIPYNFSDGLRRFFAENPEVKTIIQELISHATKEWSTINWDIGHLLERVGYSFEQAFEDLLDKGDDDSLFKAVGLMNFVDGGETALCMRIAGMTDNKSVLGSVRSLLFATGLVSGEDGIARAYESKASVMTQYLNDENPRIKKFAEEMYKNFIESAKMERKRVAEQKQLRKIEFEG